MGMKANILYISSFLLCHLIAAGNNQFVITDYGARSGGGDSSPAIVSAWNAACNSKGVVVIPRGTFVISSQVFLETCAQQPSGLAIDGTLQAASTIQSYSNANVGWFTISRVKNFGISGTGILDGGGNQLYTSGLGTSLEIFSSTSVTVSGISFSNSKMIHVKISNSNDVSLLNVNINSPGNTINTDGVHIASSNSVTITGGVIKTGDDCVSITAGSSGIVVQGITCGPGHGLSIGSLGKVSNEGDVSNIIFQDSHLNGTLYGLRVKTLCSAFGSTVSDVKYKRITMDNVRSCIQINSHYCEKGYGCQCNTESHVLIEDVSYDTISGSCVTAATMPSIDLNCSSAVPCQKLTFSKISLTPAHSSSCANVADTTCPNW